MPYKIFLICFLLGLSSGVIYELIYLARSFVLLPTTPKLPKAKKPKLRKKSRRPPYMPQRTQFNSSKTVVIKPTVEQEAPTKNLNTTTPIKRQRSLKMIGAKERLFIIFSDIVYFLVVGIIFVELSLEYNFFEPRLYMLVGVLIGIVLYCKTLHKVIAFFAGKVYNKYTKVKRSVKEYYGRRKENSHSGGNNG